MDDTHLVGGPERGEHVARELPHLGGRQWSGPAEPLAQGLARQQLHGQERDLATITLGRTVGPDVEDLQHVRILDPAGELHLRPEAAQRIRRRRCRIEQDLERDLRPEHLIVRRVHLAHPAARDEAGNPIPSRNDLAQLQVAASRGRAVGMVGPPERRPRFRRHEQLALGTGVEVALDALDAEPAQRSLERSLHLVLRETRPRHRQNKCGPPEPAGKKTTARCQLRDLAAE